MKYLTRGLIIFLSTTSICANAQSNKVSMDKQYGLVKRYIHKNYCKVLTPKNFAKYHKILAKCVAIQSSNIYTPAKRNND
jgi:hypothetical protein